MTGAITATPHADDCWLNVCPFPGALILRSDECTCGAAESDAIIQRVTKGFRNDIKEILK